MQCLDKLGEKGAILGDLHKYADQSDFDKMMNAVMFYKV